MKTYRDEMMDGSPSTLAASPVESSLLPGSTWGERIAGMLLFAVIGGLIIIAFNPLRPMLARVDDFLGRVGLSAILFAAVWLSARSRRLEKYRLVLTGLLILISAVSLDRVFSIYLLEHLGVRDDTPAGFALLKFNEFAVVVGVVILLTRTAGGSLGSIYIQRGSLKQGLTIGGSAFLIAAAGSIPMAVALFNGKDLTFARIVGWLPWVLIFVLSNAAQEEILFRGLFLRKLQPLCGRFGSNLLVVFVFTALHLGVGYASSDLLFSAILVLLGLAWGYIIQKTGSVWGSILFHAGTDIPVILGIFSTLP